ncbi:MAG: crossover junction endodeoxyribonuclease RuvC, partial [Clostridia bacterium]
VSRYKIDSSSIEDLYFNTNTKTAIKVAEARGVILNTLQDCNIPIYEYTPLQAKLAVVGYGRAEKIQVKEMVKQFLNLQQMPKLDDTTDALAIAICHTNSYRLEQCIK